MPCAQLSATIERTADAVGEPRLRMNDHFHGAARACGHGLLDLSIKLCFGYRRRCLEHRHDTDDEPRTILE
jgi:hypothetical protein